MVQTSRSKARVVMARSRLAEFDMGMVKGLENIALEVLERVRPPDATSGFMYIKGRAPQPRMSGEWLSENGTWISYLDGKRVGGDADKKPKALRAGKGAMSAVGFPFPGRFNEMGTVHQPSRPFLTPAVMEVVGSSVVYDALARGFASFTGKAVRRIMRGGIGTT